MNKNIEKSKEVGVAITLDGEIDVENNPVSTDEFGKSFISWVEKNGWSFGGSIVFINK